MRYNDGFIVGTGAARNIELGFVPSFVKITNLATRNTNEGPVAEVIAFDNGTTEIKAGMRLDAADDGWRATVKQVVLASGSWDGDNAAGWLVLEGGTLEGAANIGNNDAIHASDQADLKGAASHALVNGAGLTTIGVARPVGGGAVTAAGGITPYYGVHASNAKGFTIAAGISGDGNLLHYRAWAPDPGSGEIDMSQG